MASLRRRRQQRQSRNATVAVVAAVAVLVIAGGLAWYWTRPADEPGPATGATPAPVEEERAQPDVPPLDLPELDASDEFVRQLVAGLSAHPQLARWLVTDELVRRFVLVVVELAGSQLPTEHVDFMRPEEPFGIQETDAGLVMHPQSGQRYDLLTATFVSLDTEGTVELYWQLRPLIDEAYAELGIEERTFDQMLDSAIQNLLAVRVPEGPIPVVLGEGVTYEFEDPDLEAQRGAVKGMIRMGPENARRIQAKLQEFQREMEAAPARR